MNTERRSKVRYPLELAARYQSLGKGEAVVGLGRTVNLSSSGALMAVEHPVNEGSRLKVTIEWPSLLDGTTPLQLVTIGRVVRGGQAGFAIAFEHYQFRTMGKAAFALASMGSRAGLSNGRTPPSSSALSQKSVAAALALPNAS